eukprot:gene19666-25158_t
MGVTSMIRKVSVGTSIISAFAGVNGVTTPSSYAGPISGLRLGIMSQMSIDGDGSIVSVDYTYGVVRSIYNSTNTLSPVFAPSPLPTTSTPSLSLTPTVSDREGVDVVGSGDG